MAAPVGSPGAPVAGTNPATNQTSMQPSLFPQPPGPADGAMTPDLSGTNGPAGVPAEDPTDTGGTAGGAAPVPPGTGSGDGTGDPPVVEPDPDPVVDTDPVPTSGAEPRIPTATEACPTLRTGNVTVKGQSVQLWVGAKQPGKQGPVMFYWHGTGGRSSEATGGLGSALTEITSQGGMVASFTTTTGAGTNTGNNVWYTGDFEMADILLACAVEQLDVDTRRVYTAGCSAGGLQAGAMVYGRSSYLAGAMPNSGGVVFPSQFEDPSHIPSLITTHGAPGVDVVIIDFSNTSATITADVAAKGGYAVNCNHGGGHCGSPSAVKAAQWQFLKDHPFGVAADPYASGLPASFPSYCEAL